MAEEKKIPTKSTKPAEQKAPKKVAKTDTKKAPVKKATSPKAPAKKATTTKAPAKKVAAKKATTTKAPAKRVTAKKATTAKAPAKKVVAKEATTPKAPAKKVADKKAPAKTSAKVAGKKVSEAYTPLLKKYYRDNVVPALLKRFGYKNVMEVPRLQAISINMGIGDAKNNPKALESALRELSAISGQKAVTTKSRKDISNFKVRKGFPVGCRVTLRSNQMYEFLLRLISIALPRTRDFNGLSFKSFDRRGNFSFGVKEQIVFTEIDYDKIDSIRGMDISLSTTAKTDNEAYWLLKEFGFPLRDKPVKTEGVEAA